MITYEQAVTLLQQVVLGEIAADAAEVREAMNTFPQLREDLAELQQVQGALDDNVRFASADAAEIAAEAARMVRRGDRSRVAAARRGGRKPSHLWPLLLAATVALSAIVWFWRPFATTTGMLGGTRLIAVVQRDGVWVIEGLPQLGSGDKYEVRLMIDGKPRGDLPFDSPAITLPDSWSQLTNSASTPQLEITSHGAAGDVTIRIDWRR